MKEFIELYIGYVLGSLFNSYKEAEASHIAGDEQAETGYICAAKAFHIALMILRDKGGCDFIDERSEQQLREWCDWLKPFLEQAYYNGEYREIPCKLTEEGNADDE